MKIISRDNLPTVAAEITALNRIALGTIYCSYSPMVSKYNEIVKNE